MGVCLRDAERFTFVTKATPNPSLERTSTPGASR
jgi:hypothetical protein